MGAFGSGVQRCYDRRDFRRNGRRAGSDGLRNVGMRRATRHYSEFTWEPVDPYCVGL
jgi:hypothetical protein